MDCTEITVRSPNDSSNLWIIIAIIVTIVAIIIIIWHLCIPDVQTKYVIELLMSLIMSSMSIFPNTEKTTKQKAETQPTSMTRTDSMTTVRSQDLN